MRVTDMKLLAEGRSNAAPLQPTRAELAGVNVAAVPFWELLMHTRHVFVRVANKGVRGYGEWKIL